MDKKRILLIVAYDGLNYHGWQIQDNGDTIEGELTKAIKALTGETAVIHGASRTDAGVSGLCNRAVFDTASNIKPERFARALNTFLPNDIRVRKSLAVAEDYHPKHVKTKKTYQYVIDNEAIANPLKSHAWHVYEQLNVEKMREAAGYLLGEHDFTSFCSVKGTTLTNIRYIYSLNVEERRFFSFAGTGQDIIITITGNGFLYNMVRIIAGTLKEVGRGRLEPIEVKYILEARDRRRACITAPPQGLTLVNIEEATEPEGKDNQAFI